MVKLGRSVLLIACASCAAPVAEHPRTPAPKPPAAEEPPPQYFARLSAVRREDRAALGGGRLGVVLRGDRLIVSASGALLRRVHDPALLLGVSAVGTDAGGAGFLFRARDGLYASDAFDGSLVRVLAESPASVATGPGFAFARMADGRSVAVGLGEGAKPAFPLGTALVASSSAGLIGAVSDDGRAFLSRDRGKQWTSLEARIGTARNVTARYDQLYFEAASGETFLVTGDRVESSPLPPPAPPGEGEPGWTHNESPLELALVRGALVGRDRAVFAEAGSVQTVSLVSGEVVRRDPGALPLGVCSAVALESATLFLCGRSVHRLGEHGAELEHLFAADGGFVRGRGDQLLFAGACAGSSRPGLLCVRGKDGAWSELDRSGMLADAPKDRPLRVRTIVPKEGGALMLIEGEGGGLIDAKTGSKLPLDDKGLAVVTNLLDPTVGQAVFDRYGVDEKGRIVGFGRDGVGFRLTLDVLPDRPATVIDPLVETSPFRFGSMRSAGRRALARDPASGRYWQSEDWGFSYREVDGPPDPTSASSDIGACSDAGCVLGDWLRAGWDPRPPQARPSQPFTASSSSTPEPPRAPSLRCEVDGAQTRKALVESASGAAGLGAQTIRLDDPAYIARYAGGGAIAGAFLEGPLLRAIVSGRQPLPTEDPTASGRAAARRVQAIAPFDPAGAVIEASIKLNDLFDMSRAAGGPGPDLSTSDERGVGIVVGGDEPSLLLWGPSGPGVWLRDKRALPISFADSSPPDLLAAVELSKDELAVLVTTGDGVAVRTVGRGRTSDVFQVAALASSAGSDTVAVGPNRELVVLRVRTDAPPTADQPAVVLRPGKPPLPLAAWSTLTDGSAPDCESVGGYRAVVATRGRWLSVAARGSDTSFDERPTLLLVRWSESRVCLDAAEVPYLSHELPNGTSAESVLVARLRAAGGKGAAGAGGQLLVAEGAELREKRRCTLAP